MNTVLVIDDASLMRKLLKKVLAPEYKICAEASNGEDGIKQYEKHNPDVVLCDISMPGMNGMECMQWILAYDPNAKIIMCTSQGKENFADEAIEAGAKSYIEKPVHAEKALKVIARVLEGGSLDYKELMMERATAEGLCHKDVLDFLDTFRTITGKDMGDLSVDRKFILERKESVKIGAEAFLAAKLEFDHINRLVEVFSKLTEHPVGS
ncbi:MAG: response regulator [Lachnospiraceae bacterium]|nr:response regulator [Lachnospiraceae bacterium]